MNSKIFKLLFLKSKKKLEVLKMRVLGQTNYWWRGALTPPPLACFGLRRIKGKI